MSGTMIGWSRHQGIDTNADIVRQRNLDNFCVTFAGARLLRSLAFRRRKQSLPLSSYRSSGSASLSVQVRERCVKASP